MKKYLLAISLITSVSILSAQQNEWTWMKGTSGSNGPAVYGTQGVPDPANTPGAMYEATEWTDHDGNFWMFGGLKDGGSEYNTMWKFDPTTNEWTWVRGATTCCQAGNYGTQGVPSATNMPGARAWGAWQWVDTAGNLWLYGGIGYDATGGFEVLSDLWRYNIATDEWTWMKGPNTNTIAVFYGTMGQGTTQTRPGARAESDASWVDDSNRLWLFGGALYFPTMGGWSIGGFGNDMWMWDPNTNLWTWMQGTQTLSGNGVYGTKGVPDPANYPPGRGSYSKWEDSIGNFYFFGGYNLSANWNDLWKYDWQTNEFTWVSGPSTSNGAGTYGTQGVPDVNNIPPSRYENRAFWQDGCGDFWLWGGAGPTGFYNDLWHYKISTGEWTWVSGSSTPNSPGNYGTQGISSPTNEPPAKFGAIGLIDNNGNLWMASGSTGFFSNKNDMWRYVPDSIICSTVQTNPVSFGASDTVLCEKFCIDFFDLSSNNPIAWEWLFEFANPATSSDQNPIGVCYDDPGVYDVMLITTDAGGNQDTLLLTDFITVYPNPFAPVITQNGNLLTSSSAFAYQWYLNGNIIPGATNQSYTITQDGLYTVFVYDDNGCFSQASIDATLVGIGETGDQWDISIFPNPATDEVVIDALIATATEIEISLYNALGQRIMSAVQLNSHFTATLDLKDYSPAVYFLEVKAQDRMKLFKVIRQ